MPLFYRKRGHSRKKLSSLTRLKNLEDEENGYRHKGSFSQPTGKPIAIMSMDGYSAKSVSIFAFISLLGDMMSRKYLIMQRLK